LTRIMFLVASMFKKVGKRMNIGEAMIKRKLKEIWEVM